MILKNQRNVLHTWTTIIYDNSSRDCVLEVDLKYPKELREFHYDYPLAPDNLEIKEMKLGNGEMKSRNVV